MKIEWLMELVVGKLSVKGTSVSSRVPVKCEEDLKQRIKRRCQFGAFILLVWSE